MRLNPTTPEWLKNKRDKNEPEIIERILDWGAGWRACCRHAGHDGWAIWVQEFFCIEIKNPAEKWALTRAEERMKKWVEGNGGKYYILQYPGDVDKMFEEFKK